MIVYFISPPRAADSGYVNAQQPPKASSLSIHNSVARSGQVEDAELSTPKVSQIHVNRQTLASWYPAPCGSRTGGGGGGCCWWCGGGVDSLSSTFVFLRPSSTFCERTKTSPEYLTSN